MPKNILHLYPNCSLGGMTTVYRNRAVSDPDTHYTFLFMNDKSGSVAYEALPNATIRISRPDRFNALVNYAFQNVEYDSVSITSLPEVVAQLGETSADVIYEFHSSDQNVIQRELDILDVTKVDMIAAPSEFLADVVRSKLSGIQREKVTVIPNLVDAATFSEDGPISPLDIPVGVFPLVWIGRLDKGKNVNDFLRVLSLLPKQYMGVIVLSFEDQPERMAHFLGLASSLGVEGRIKVVLNVSQSDIANLYRFARIRHGLFCSTSLGESFGYGVAEAIAVGLPAIAYDVGALSELDDPGVDFRLVPVGDVRGFAQHIAERAGRGLL